MRTKVEEDHPALFIARHVSQKLNPKCRDRFIECLIVNTLLRGVAKRKEFMASAPGLWAPTTILMSPTMRCNLSVRGLLRGGVPAATRTSSPRSCRRWSTRATRWASTSSPCSGAEPFIYDGLLDLAARNQDSYFQVYTNGTLIDEEVVDELADLGNVAPMLSLEGDEAATDARRGHGVYRQLLEIMDMLGDRGVVFGYSATVTRDNWRMLISDEWVDPLRRQGRAPQLELPLHADRPRPEHGTHAHTGGAQRVPRRRRCASATRSRSSRSTSGVTPRTSRGASPGKHYMHVNSEGWVEPCIFTHFATDNIHDTSLADAFNSPYFREIRRRQPFSHNLLKPCMLIDNPEQSREIMALTGAQPTHPGAESLFTELRADIDEYAASVERVYGEVWSCMAGQPAQVREVAPIH